jgi:hypothetical protein
MDSQASAGDVAGTEVSGGGVFIRKARVRSECRRMRLQIQGGSSDT